MEPVEIGGEVWVVWGGYETVVAVFGKNVLHDSTRFGEDQVAIGYDWRSADRMQCLVLGWCEHRHRVTRVEL